MIFLRIYLINYNIVFYIDSIKKFLLEIRQLDGDMKTLVYENYSKFISATDTIRKVTNKILIINLNCKQIFKV
jgi:hypothetical protein